MRNIENSFDFMSFNKELAFAQGKGWFAIVLDPGDISKSGKQIPGIE